MKAAFLDIDGTLAQGSSWERVTVRLGGSIDDLYSSLVRLQSGEITTEKSIDEVVTNWTRSGMATVDVIRSTFESISLAEGAEGFVNRLVRHGYEPVLLTGSMNLFAENIAKRLGVVAFFYNSELLFDDAGSLKDLTYEPNQAKLKTEQATQYCKANQINIEDCIAVGDSENDIKLFSLVGKSFALKRDSVSVETAATDVVNSLADIDDSILEM